MSRRHAAEKREILPDPKFGDITLSRFINRVMEEGKKSIAETIVYGALDNIAGRKNAADLAVNPDIAKKHLGLAIFYLAVSKVKPLVEVRSRRVGGATYQVPVEVRAERSQALAFKWLIDAARKRGEHTMQDRLAAEIFEASNERGSAIKKREDTHKMADANKAFAHFRWGAGEKKTGGDRSSAAA
jgi:small subunit ribosomal protein S7